jgi:hypothetical protein
MLSGALPFDGDDEKEIYYNITQYKPGQLAIPEELSAAGASFVAALLQEEESRLSVAGIKTHHFFQGLDFEALPQQRPPYLPEITSSDDTSHFEPVDESELRKAIPRTPARNEAGFDTSLLNFVGFSYARDVQGGAGVAAEKAVPEPASACAVDYATAVAQLRAENASLSSQLAKARAKLRRSNDSVQLAALSQQTSPGPSSDQAKEMEEMQSSVSMLLAISRVRLLCLRCVSVAFFAPHPFSPKSVSSL